MDDLIEALQILKKYLGESNTHNPTCCEHDILMVPGAPEELEEADWKRLDELGFFWSGEFECWASFRFGSC